MIAWVVLQHLALMALGVWAVGVQFVYRIPGTILIVVLPWVGVGLLGLGMVTAVHEILRRGRGDPELRGRVALLERVGTGLVLAFGLYGAGVYLNGRIAAPAEVRESEVLAVQGAELDLGPWTAYAWVTLRSWRTPGGVEHVVLQPGERRWFWGGRPVRLHLRQGLFKAVWVTRIEPDEEKRLRAVLAVAPTASQAWKDLVQWYLRLGRYEDAKVATQQYLARFPHDEAFALRIAHAFYSAARWADAVPVLEPLLAGTPSFEVYRTLGFALTQATRRREGIALLRKAIAMAPDDWWTYYALGTAHVEAGEFAEAVPVFERLLELRPQFPEITEELRRIRPLAARSPATRPTP